MAIPPISPRYSGDTPGGSSWRVIYDSDCGLCSRAVAWMRSRTRLMDLEWIPLTSEQALALVPDRPADEMALVSPRGEVWFGGDAWIVCLWTLKNHRWFSRILALPGIRSIVRWAYGEVARRRHRISRLWGDSCQIP